MYHACVPRMSLLHADDNGCAHGVYDVIWCVQSCIYNVRMWWMRPYRGCQGICHLHCMSAHFGDDSNDDRLTI